jgi:hypothetical protein
LTPTHTSGQHESRTLKVEPRAIKRLTFGLFEKKWNQDNGFMNFRKTIGLTFSDQGTDVVYMFPGFVVSADWMIIYSIFKTYNIISWN